MSTTSTEALRAAIDGVAFVQRNRGRRFRHNTDPSILVDLVGGVINDDNDATRVLFRRVEEGPAPEGVLLFETTAKFKATYTRTKPVLTFVDDADAVA